MRNKRSALVQTLLITAAAAAGVLFGRSLPNQAASPAPMNAPTVLPTPTNDPALTATAQAQIDLATAAAQMTATASAQMTAAADADSYQACSWQWASRPLDDLSASLQDRLKAAGLNANGQAEAYGENCVNAAGEVQRFIAMQTDFRITVQVENLDAPEQLGQLVETILPVILEIPPEKLAGQEYGQIGITFETPAGEKLHIWQPFMKVVSLRSSGLNGAALFESLRNP